MINIVCVLQSLRVTTTQRSSVNLSFCITRSRLARILQTTSHFNSPCAIVIRRMSSFPPLKERPIKDTVVLFDVDETLTPARRFVSPQILEMLQQLRTQVAIGFVGGSNLPKQQEQLAAGDVNVVDMFDYAFAENGLTAYRQSKQLSSESFISWIGEAQYKKLAKFILHYIADLDIPIQRGTFIEFRNGMINVSPIGRNASIQERHEFEAYDKIHHIREDMVAALRKQFSDLAVTYSIGGQISFDVFPTGWDKTYCLKHIEADGWKHIHFFGDKTYKGGNDYEIYTDKRVIGHSVHGPEDTLEQVTNLFLNKQ